MTPLLIATSNPGKLREYRALLASLKATLMTPDDLGIRLTVEETGQSYAENAKLKSEALAAASGLVTLGDDSGLEVDALQGRPGLHSARSSGPDADDADRRRKLLHELSHIPAPRPARFVCVVAITGPGMGTREFTGICPGEIVLEERGSNGFGYDPIFYLPDYNATMAEMPGAVKNRLSHRGRAVESARRYLAEALG